MGVEKDVGPIGKFFTPIVRCKLNENMINNGLSSFALIARVDMMLVHLFFFFFQIAFK